MAARRMPPRTEKQERALESAHKKIAEKQAQSGKTTKPVTSTGGAVRRGRAENA